MQDAANDSQEREGQGRSRLSNQKQAGGHDRDGERRLQIRQAHVRQMRNDANGKGLSRKAILTEIDHSLRRLGMDYVDLYQIHRFDPETPLEETLEALNDVVRAGKARYIGASSMWAWQFMQALALQKANGWARFISMQNHLNLIYREEEREMLPLCRDQGVGVIPWSPLARGRLTRAPETQTARSESDRFGGYLYKKSEDSDRAILEAVYNGLDVSLDRGQEIESSLFGRLSATPDAREGMNAFLAKRTPRFGAQ